jgi:hypothetical protein
LAVRLTRPTAAVPIAILIAFEPLALTPPEIAVITAVPLFVPAENVATAWPFTSVCALAGWMVPRFVVKVTCVPECGGEPDAAMTCARICVVPFTGSAFAPAVKVITDPDGASSGTF